MLPLLCPVDDCLSAVEVGPSRVAARLLSLAPKMSCTFGVQAACQYHEATHEDDCKTVVAHAGGWRSWVVVFPCARIFCGWGREKSLSAGLTLTRCRRRVAPFLPGGRRGNPLSTVSYVPGETLGPVWSGQQRRLDDVSLPEGAAWYGAPRSAEGVVGRRRRAQQLRVIIVSSLRLCLLFFSFLGMFVL